MSKKDHSDWLSRRRKHLAGQDPELLFQRIRQGDRVALAEGITLIESEHPDHKLKADRLIELCLPHSGHSIRLGITGVPGVGKSTFIESFGSQLIADGGKLAVLAIDPTSGISGGSILGDKTRMEVLSNHPDVFIRPSAAGDSLGGVARKTRESVFLCEAAGFDHVIIETVGVGQSETVVKSMVDFFLLLMLAGAGDELQVIKKGIMEMADAVIITKADGENVLKAKQAEVQYKNALHLFQPNPNGWIPETGICSSVENTGIEKIVEMIQRFERNMTLNGWLQKNRESQSGKWLIESLNERILDAFYTDSTCVTALNEMKMKVISNEISPYRAAEELYRIFQLME